MIASQNAEPAGSGWRLKVNGFLWEAIREVNL
jgi:hypothetical protein